MWRCFLVLFCALIVQIGTAINELPSYFPRCRRTDPDMEKCLLAATEQVRPYLKEGIPDFLPSILNFTVQKIVLEQGNNAINYKAVLNDLTLLGLEDYKFTRYYFDTNDKSFSLEVELPHIFLSGQYDLNGNLFFAPLRGNGAFAANLTKSVCLVYHTIEIIDKNGIDYIKPGNTTSEMKIGKVTDYKFDGLFGGNKQLGILCSTLIPDFLKSDFFNIYRHAAVETRELQDRPVERDSITYYLFTKNNPDHFVKVHRFDLSALANEHKKLVFIIHGWTGYREVPWYEDLKNAFLATYGDEYSVVQVDWKEPANQFYYVSSINTYDVASHIADMLQDLNKNYHVGFDKILLVGHSLGGQVVGFIGKHITKKTGRKLPRIIALDPAGPFFESRPNTKRLNSTDAEVVEVIHSDGGTFGYEYPCGTIDFFPNGGNSQPGCKRIDLLDIASVTDIIVCDHHRSYDYFIEALLNPHELIARRCEEYGGLFTQEKCDNVEVPMGDLTTTLTGKFYLETNKERPFSRKGRRSSNIPGVKGVKKVLSIIPSIPSIPSIG